MTNYNERLEEILDNHATSYVRQTIKVIKDGANVNTVTKMNDTDTQSKQALTSLIKELAAEAKPKTMPSNLSPENYEKCERVVNQYHQNLLKGLEEV